MYNGKDEAFPSIRDLRIKAAQLTGNDYYRTMHQLDALAGNGAMSDREMQHALAPIAERLSGGSHYRPAAEHYAQGQPAGPDIPPPPDSPAQPDLVPTPDIPASPDSPAHPAIDPGPDIPPAPDSPAQPDAPPTEISSSPCMAGDFHEPDQHRAAADNAGEHPGAILSAAASLTSPFAAMRPPPNGFDQLAEASWRRVQEVAAGYTPSQPPAPEPEPLQAVAESAISPEAANDGELERRSSRDALLPPAGPQVVVASPPDAEPPSAAATAAPPETPDEAALPPEAASLMAQDKATDGISSEAAAPAPTLAGADLANEAEGPEAAVVRETQQAMSDAEKLVAEATPVPELPHTESEPADPEERFPQTIAAHDPSREKATRRGLFSRLFGGRHA